MHGSGCQPQNYNGQNKAFVINNIVWYLWLQLTGLYLIGMEEGHK